MKAWPDLIRHRRGISEGRSAAACTPFHLKRVVLKASARVVGVLPCATALEPADEPSGFTEAEKWVPR